VFLPHGLLGLVVASLAAAYMSTISTHLNWGASYIVDDVYRRFLAPNREEKNYVMVARVSTVALIVLSSLASLQLNTAQQGFQILLQIGAGTGLVFLLRWFWWRINTWSEISAMVISFVVALYFGFVHTGLGFEKWNSSAELVAGVAVTTVGWLLVTYLTPPVDTGTLRDFHAKIQPLGRGWDAVVPRVEAKASGLGDSGGEFAAGLLAWFLGCVMVYGALFGTGFLLYGNVFWGGLSLVVAAFAGRAVLKLLPKVGFLT
jgi:Na+/proline symporter